MGADNDMRRQLEQMGFNEGQIQLVTDKGIKDMDQAVEFIVSGGSSGGGPANGVEGGRGGAGTETRKPNEVPTLKLKSSPGVGQPNPRDAAGHAQAPSRSVEDDNLQRAVELSKLESHPDQQMQQAISESLESSKPGQATSSTFTLQWLKELYKNPRERGRSSLGELVGLRNLGNTCYLNCVLQLYYCLPNFRRAVFQFRRPPAEKDAEADQQVTYALDFVQELQQLFAAMALGPYKFADPSPLFETLGDRFGNRVERGSQQDVAEFNGLLLDVLERAFSHTKVDVQDAVNPIKSLFTSKFVEQIVVDGKMELENRSETNAFVVNVSQSTGKDIYWGLDEYVRTKVELRPEVAQDADHEGMDVDAGRELRKGSMHIWFTELAPVATIYTTRVKYNKELQVAEKVHDFFILEEEVAFDRYLQANQMASVKTREAVDELRRQREKLDQWRNDYEQVSGSEQTDHQEVTLSSILRTRTRLQRSLEDGTFLGLSGVPAPQVAEAVEFLQRVYDEDLKRLTAWKEEKDRLYLEERRAYEPLSKIKYQLFAVVVHAGAPSSGHYWTYVRGGNDGGEEEKTGSSSTGDAAATARGAQKPWTRFDDLSVRPADMEEVRTDGEGGHGGRTASAYSLVYVRNDQGTDFVFSAPQATKEAQQLLPDSILARISEQREAYEQEIIEYDRNEAVKKYKQDLQGVIDHALTQLISVRGDSLSSKLRSRADFVYALNPDRPELAFIQALADAYAEHGNLFDACQQSMFSATPSATVNGAPAPKADMGLLKEMLSTQKIDEGSSIEVICRQAAANLFNGSHLWDAREKLQEYNDMYIAALRSSALAKCACEATLNGVWSRAILLWSHVLRKTYRSGSRVPEQAYQALESHKNLQHLNHNDFALASLSVVLVAASTAELEMLERGGEMGSVIVNGMEIQGCLFTFFMPDSVVTKVVSNQWIAGSVARGEPKEMDQLVDGYNMSIDSVAVANVPPIDDDARRELDEIEEAARSKPWMNDFARRYDELHKQLADIQKDIEQVQGLQEAASQLRALVKWNATF